MTTDDILGAGNGVPEYLVVLLVYGLMFVLIRYPKPVLELNYKRTFTFLAIFWSMLMFGGNYISYLLGIMSFLPWLNNVIHTFIWLAFCLTWLYYASNQRPLWEQVVFFVWTSFIVKVAEHLVLGTWSMPVYLGIHNPYAYIVAMSLFDGIYPVVTRGVLRFYGKAAKQGESVNS